MTLSTKKDIFAETDKSMSGFQFKQFKIEQDRCAMKVGTDGVLIGCWCDTNDVHNVLDIGTGTGLIALMVAQRTSNNCHITGIEIDNEAAKQARENVAESPWSGRITIVDQKMQDYQPTTPFDLIVSNPPYFTNALKAPDAKRSAARHNDSLSVEDIVHFAARHLNDKGRLAVVLPCEEGKRLQAESIACGLYVRRTTWVKTTIKKEPKRVLVEVGRQKTDCLTEDTLVLSNGINNEKTEQFIHLVKDFYLHY